VPRKGKAFAAGGSEYLDEPLASSVNGLSFFLSLIHSGSQAAQMDSGIEAIAKPGKMYPGTTSLKSTRPTESGDPLRCESGYTIPGFALFADLYSPACYPEGGLALIIGAVWGESRTPHPPPGLWKRFFPIELRITFIESTTCFLFLLTDQ
jgi:hypothetical protein